MKSIFPLTLSLNCFWILEQILQPLFDHITIELSSFKNFEKTESIPFDFSSLPSVYFHVNLEFISFNYFAMAFFSFSSKDKRNQSSNEF